MSGSHTTDRSSREYPDRPWVGVGVIVWRGDRVLMIRRGKAPRLGQWSLPGGAQSVGETVFETAVREVREETGLAVEPTGIVTVVDAITPDDALEACWATPDEAGELTEWDETRRVILLAAAQRSAR